MSLEQKLAEAQSAQRTAEHDRTVAELGMERMALVLRELREWPGVTKSQRRQIDKALDRPLSLEPHPAPRETDCVYGCCEAGDEGLFSEAVA